MGAPLDEKTKQNIIHMSHLISPEEISLFLKVSIRSVKRVINANRVMSGDLASAGKSQDIDPKEKSRGRPNKLGEAELAVSRPVG